ncbi:MAG: glucose-1-phosphate adenylyltransferase [Candidatus Omnitrophica bacterium]|nr:glucose-1-phosphate adenylyltransferase [Candidatus Omnitrophota bacterium]
MKEVLSIILGGGRGTRLYPLTKYRAKPAVPLAGKYRLIDIPISNCINSGFQKIFILTQFQSGSLNRHIFRAYKLDAFSGGFVEIIAAEQSVQQSDWFQGSADAVRKCLQHFNVPKVKYILVLSGDQLYRMNFNELLRFHIKKKSEVTIACNGVSAEEAPELGIMGTNGDFRIRKFVEKPKDKKDYKDLAIQINGKDSYLASMGIYLFNKEVLTDLVANNSQNDFGREIIPAAVETRRTHAFVYNGYWKDIGSIKSFYEENLAFADPEPPLNLYDENWPFFTRPRFLPLSKFLDSHIRNSSIAEGAVITNAKISHSVIGLRSIIGPDTIIEDSIVMGNDYYEDISTYKQKKKVRLEIGKRCYIKRAIIDKNVRMGSGVKLVNKKNLQEFENDYCVIRNGIIIVPKNTVIPSGFVI